ncbi:hypothetical protein P170DRAFT_252922 [Aspergillus steynii IBT 23096]|uniref:Uncharacterized protein n=1 Tax=Aspergillus steynii IBT 23096 TaxID=1392250 RepID=A0A2I2FYV2_9EURO|nr:uncharacterized protein P170DRAFT_252922 [Aspergillus steynii IBT 23096]PLB45807.1 hypothetical protein P170DRAFT_252922 [Aspergillus steynii IBT 23096]
MPSYLSDIDVVYGTDKSWEPSDAIHVVDANNGDINAGYGGEFVWLVPKWSFESDNAVSNIRILIQGDSDGNYKDLAKGAGGKFRYLRLERDGHDKITDVRLLRRDDEVKWETVKSLGFDGFTNDINDGRGKSFLYLVWKSH